MRMHNPPHPGQLLREYLGGMSVSEAAKRLGVTRVALSRIINEKAAISADMAVRLSILLNTSSQLWAGMQMEHDLWHAQRNNHSFVVPVTQPLLIKPKP